MNNEGKLKWAILTSRWGRNASDLIGAFQDGKLANSEISLLIYDALPCGAAEAACVYSSPISGIRKPISAI